ncbi:hypothetical protein [Vibrio splendidus]|uniref:Uncharacterized protein n=1 Tax=Vibrio splendidus TaxID=29497 RepID=A0A7Y4DBI2_VIBSP|nr:hypothetical protein [Vibrio splendidus]NOJ15774.1 hypothetical protein [Vibrio splendidus]
MKARDSQEILKQLLTKELARLEKNLKTTKAKNEAPDNNELQKLRANTFKLEGQLFLDALEKLEAAEAKQTKFWNQDLNKIFDQEFKLECEIKTVKGLIHSVEMKCALGMFIR